MNRILVKSLILVALLSALVSCSGRPPAPTTVLIPSATASLAPTDTATPTPTITLTPSPKPTSTMTYTPTPHPAQVFAEPILAVVANIPPHFADDFSNGNIGWSWNTRMASQVQIADGVMKVNGMGGHGIFPPLNLLNSKNFVFEFDVRLLDNDTGIGTFFRQQSSKIWYSFMIYGHFIECLNVSTQDGAGRCSYGEPNIRPLGEVNHIVLIARSDQFAVYLNGQPAAYLQDGTYPQAGNLMPTFNGQQRHAQGEFDNFKFWDLDKVKELP